MGFLGFGLWRQVSGFLWRAGSSNVELVLWLPSVGICTVFDVWVKYIVMGIELLFWLSSLLKFEFRPPFLVFSWGNMDALLSGFLCNFIGKLMTIMDIIVPYQHFRGSQFCLLMVFVIFLWLHFFQFPFCKVSLFSVARHRGFWRLGLQVWNRGFSRWLYLSFLLHFYRQGDFLTLFAY